MHRRFTYSGELDIVCNYMGAERMLTELEWNGATGLGGVS